MQASAELRPLLEPRGARRSLVLAGVFLVAAALAWALQSAQPAVTTSRWPTDSATYAVAGWTASTARSESANGNVYLSRDYVRGTAPNTPVTFILTTSNSVKSVYRAGADVPFLGSGYEREEVTAGLIPEVQTRGVSVLRRGDDRWLQLYAYGERRGLLGNGPLGWSVAIFDAVLGRANDYYLVRILTPISTLDASTAAPAVELADALFPRMVDWYAQ